MLVEVTLKDVSLDIQLPDHDPDSEVLGTLVLQMGIGYGYVIDQFESITFLTASPTRHETEEWTLNVDTWGPKIEEKFIDQLIGPIVQEIREMDMEYAERNRMILEEQIREQTRTRK